MSVTKIYLDLTEELQQLLSENQTSIADILKHENIEAKFAYGKIPDYEDQEGRSKDVVTIILASSAAIVAIGIAISIVLHTLNRKPHLVQVEELVELRDAGGNLLLDATGTPQFKRIKKYELLEPRPEDSGKNFEMENKDGSFVLKVSAETKQIK